MNFRTPRNLIEYIRVFNLYGKAFPIEEKKPISTILKMHRAEKTDIWYFEENGRFLGLAITINGPDTILIDYFAVCEKHRSRGHGQMMLKSLISHYSDFGVFLEIEVPYEWADNYTDRYRRRSFYLDKVGLIPMETKAKLFGVDMELLGTPGCRLTYDEYRQFYLDNYGRFAYDHITPADGKS